MVKKSFLYIFFFCVVFGNAQQPASLQLTEKDGLPDIEFYNIIEDSKQFIWLAADKGLYRYDGQNYDYYAHPKQHGNAVFGTLEDTQGRIWCNNIAGQFFYVEDNELKLFIDLGHQLNGELSSFEVTPTHLIVFTGKLILKISLSTEKISKPFGNEFAYVGTPLSLSNSYYYTKKDYIVKANMFFEAKDSLKIDVLSTELYKTQISRRVNLASDGKQFFCHFLKSEVNVIYHFDFKTSSYKPLIVPDIIKKRNISQVAFVNDQIWFATDLGIQIFTLKNNELHFENQLFKNAFVTKVIVDSDKNYWITTKGDGIYVIPNINVFQYELPDKLKNISKVQKIDNNRLLFGTNKGKISVLKTDDNGLKTINSSSDFRVTEIVMMKNNNAIITKEDVAYILHTKNLKISKIDEATIRGAKSLSQIDVDNFVLSSYKNAFILDKNFKEKQNLIKKRSYTNAYSEAIKTIFVGSVEGLFSFDSAYSRAEIKFKNSPILAVAMTETNDAMLWVSTFNNGIFGIKNDSVVVNYNKENGLLSNKTGVVKGDGNSLWITTEKGVQLLDVNSGTFKNLTKQNGIPSYRISDIEIIDDEVFFASNIGLFGLHKQKGFKPQNPKPVYFTKVKIGEETKPIKSNYKLNYDENKIEFAFNTNGFQSNINTTYQYRLLGEDENWKETNELVNTVSYNSLSGGDYSFQVKSSSNPNLIKTIDFKVLKPFWETWWFYLASLILMGALVYFIFLRQIRKLKRKQREMLQKEQINKQLVLSQLENLRSQMNPHFIFNALNSIQEYIVLNEKDLASSYLIKFSRLMRIYLEHSREDEVLLSEEIKALNIYLELEKNRFEDALDYKINVAESINSKRIKIPSLFIQPYVENALKHGLLHKSDNRKLLLDFGLNGLKNTLICAIKDNGIGVEASKQLNKDRNPHHKSFATTANEKRVRLLNIDRENKILVKTKSLKTETENGTQITITIPL